MQILQKSGKYTIPAIACSWKRTKKVVHCGSQDHMVIDFKKSFTSQPQRIDSDECWRMFKDKDVTLMQTHSSDTSERWKNRYKLKINYENRFSYFELGDTYPYWDLVGGSSIACNGGNLKFDEGYVSNMVIHNEDLIEVINVTLLIDTETNQVMDRNNKNILDCLPIKGECRFGSFQYVWKPKKQTCNLLATKEVEGQLIQLGTSAKFITNSSLIDLKLENRVQVCNRRVYPTDFKDIFLLDMETEEPIQDDIAPEDVNVFKDFSVRDKFIFNRMNELLKKNVKQLAHQHCVDMSFNHQQMARLHTRIKASTLQSFSIYRNSGKYIIPVGEGLYHYTCTPKLVQPIHLDDKNCYNHLPVVELTKDLIPASTNKVLFLTPFERQLVMDGAIIPCSENFPPKYRTASGQWIAATKM